MSKTQTHEDSVARLHSVLVEMGRYGPLRNPLSDSEGLATDLTSGQMHVLIRLGHDGPLAMGELSARIGLSLPGCTRLVDRMKDAGQVLRDRDTVDRRVVIVRLSAGGRRLFEELDAGAREKINGILSILEPDDRQQLVIILEKLSAGIAQKVAELSGAKESTP